MKKFRLTLLAGLVAVGSFASNAGTLSRYKYDHSIDPEGDPAYGIDHWEPGYEQLISALRASGAATFIGGWKPVVDHAFPVAKT
jgi:hypothetical protein